ncbi:hypothetical protein QFC24_003885 [Naganishia onofrii]|uniref:Uncharacterized protein n=1 Tax=Naganishia onofrii TaxID=1851511 RepID=A0ACC2XG95_9TREE|nr:hypothetical protein QFC24_003885 [Naganishia onofrii]
MFLYRRLTTTASIITVGHTKEEVGAGKPSCSVVREPLPGDAEGCIRFSVYSPYKDSKINFVVGFRTYMHKGVVRKQPYWTILGAYGEPKRTGYTYDYEYFKLKESEEFDTFVESRMRKSPALEIKVALDSLLKWLSDDERAVIQLAHDHGLDWFTEEIRLTIQFFLQVHLEGLE